MHPYRKYGHLNDPAWLRGIEKYVEKHGQADVDDTIRNYGGSKKIVEAAAYDIDEEKS
jgi:hypothetical protein